MENQENSYKMAEFALRQSWETHRQAFGPILEPAFAENPQVRIPLIAALNHISRREIREGMDKLKEIQPFCIYDEDKAAWAFFVGLCFELAGSKKHMLKWYADSAKYHHRFYLPYLKLARAAMDEKQYENARSYYETGIKCLLEMSGEGQDGVLLGAAYTNYASCLTMLHQYETARQAWTQAQQYPLQPGAPAVGAVLYAAMGEPERAIAYLEQLKKQHPALAEGTQTAVRQILSGTHPDFPGEQ